MVALGIKVFLPKMGNDEEGKSSKSEKSESPTTAAAATTTTTTEQTSIHVYPDWAAMQAYYGPRVAIPPYYGSHVPSGHAPHAYMWAPSQPMMPPYGPPYAAVFPHGGMYGHPAVPLGLHPHATGTPSSPMAAVSMGVEMPTKSTASIDRGLTKKLKGFDGLAMSIGHVDGASNNAVGSKKKLSQSSETETSTDHSNGNTSGGMKRSREGSPAQGGSVTLESRAGFVASVEANGSSTKALVPTVASACSDGKSVGVPITPGMNMTLELRNPSSANAANANATVNCVPQSSVVLPPETWLQSDRELKRERRKQSNRESARRSRLRKQAETEELALKVELLTDENVALKSEMSQLEEKSQKLRLENAALMERLKKGPSRGKQIIMLSNTDEKNTEVTTENLLSRVDNAALVDRGVAEEVELYQREPNSGAKLHQLLDASQRTDAVAAG